MKGSSDALAVPCAYIPCCGTLSSSTSISMASGGLVWLHPTSVLVMFTTGGVGIAVHGNEDSTCKM